MLPALLKNVTPELLTGYVKSNPALVLATLQKFETFQLFGAALTYDQQVVLSNNLHRVNEFLISEEGKEYVCLLVDTFAGFVKK